MHNRPDLGGTGHRRHRPVGAAQLDIVSGIPLPDGRAAKLVTGIDDHSRFVVISAVVMVPTGRAVCEASAAAMRRYEVPGEVLTDNGRQFTGRYTRPQPAEVPMTRCQRQRQDGCGHFSAPPGCPRDGCA